LNESVKAFMKDNELNESVKAFMKKNITNVLVMLTFLAPGISAHDVLLARI